MFSGHFHLFAPYYIILCLNHSSVQQYGHVNFFSNICKHTAVECDVIIANDIKQNIFGGVSGKIL